MYAVISSGGKQARVEEGARLDVELLAGEEGDEVTLTPVLVVDGDTVLATPDALKGASVAARIVGEAKGPKIRAMTYQAKARRRRRWGHRQRYTSVEIMSINTGERPEGDQPSDQSEQSGPAPSPDPLPEQDQAQEASDHTGEQEG